MGHSVTEGCGEKDCVRCGNVIAKPGGIYKCCDISSFQLESGDEPTRLRIVEVCNSIRDMLLSKNASYGNSALEPVRIFSKADPVEQLKVRLDDKLSRLMKGTDYPGDNDRRDLIGYLILLEVAEGEQPPSFADEVAKRMSRSTKD